MSSLASQARALVKNSSTISLSQAHQVSLPASHKKEPRERSPTPRSHATLPPQNRRTSPRAVPAKKAPLPPAARGRRCSIQADNESRLANAPSGGNTSFPQPPKALALDEVLQDSPPQTSPVPSPAGVDAALQKSQNLLNHLNSLGLLDDSAERMLGDVEEDDHKLTAVPCESEVPLPSLQACPDSAPSVPGLAEVPVQLLQMLGDMWQNLQEAEQEKKQLQKQSSQQQLELLQQHRSKSGSEYGSSVSTVAPNSPTLSDQTTPRATSGLSDTEAKLIMELRQALSAGLPSKDALQVRSQVSSLASSYAPVQIQAAPTQAACQQAHLRRHGSHALLPTAACPVASSFGASSYCPPPRTAAVSPCRCRAASPPPRCSMGGSPPPRSKRYSWCSMTTTTSTTTHFLTVS
eukprot:gnl/TRDRNA2_/TRDRNA2_186008_c0_seq1.p1 gnl/TRDRNA2_/TRDRNA2_186008_c0~~gnl/TRDRNA2_/TRDRNA2_186008_c0_seq1.p1  ORF type:complete len:407 (-),score=80.94 gnl/TRDRNA2_/TRDRNA2_186008_c0_seq1:152-1372(-)